NPVRRSFTIDRRRLWNTGSPAFAGDDGNGAGASASPSLRTQDQDMIEATQIDRVPAATGAPAPLLSVNNIEVVYDDVILVLRGLSLEVPKGTIVALLGANGAGKSTTLKAISGLLKTEDGEVTRGEIVFNGERINGIDPDKIVRRGIFQVMEGRRIVADMTSLENLRLGAFTRGDREVDADIDMVYRYFPRLKERTGL